MTGFLTSHWVHGLCLLIGFFLGLVGGAYMSKAERIAAELSVRELRRANTHLSAQVMADRTAGAPAKAAPPPSTEGR
jgi:hypothetical protein